jgi:hypothetical protein
MQFAVRKVERKQHPLPYPCVVLPPASAAALLKQAGDGCIFREERDVLCETPSAFEFSLCLFRTCLGKMVHFMYEWRKKWRF